MNLEQEFPLRCYINLFRRADRKAAMEKKLADVGMTANRIDAVDGDFLKDTRGFKRTTTRAIAITARSIIHQAFVKNFDAVLIMEDDLVFCPHFRARVDEIELPRDWGMFYFGCIHCEQPTWYSDNVVKVSGCLDAHAYAIRRPYFMEVCEVLQDGPVGSKGERHNDTSLMSLHKKIPTYAAHPNLIWQGEDYSDNAHKTYSNYTPDGAQKILTQFLPTSIKSKS